jgi:hypothetical protein
MWIPSSATMSQARAAEVARHRAEAKRLRGEGEAALERGDAKAATRAFDRAVLREEIAAGLERGEGAGLLAREHQRTVHEMLAVHKAKISEGRSSDPLAAAARRAGLGGMRGLAKKLGVSVSLLSMARRGERSITRALAERVERATRTGEGDAAESGFAANRRNWPDLKD